MTPHLDVAAARDVAVLHGVDSEAALAHLARSLVTGSVFDAYRALVIDLDGRVELAAATAEQLERAGEAFRRRSRWLGVARAGELDGVVAQAQEWLRLVDRDRAMGAAARVVRGSAGLVTGVASAAVGLGMSVLRRFRVQRPNGQGRSAHG